MLSAGETVLFLDVPNTLKWRSDERPYTLAQSDLGQLRVTVYKSADRLIHIHAVADRGRMAARTDEGLSVEPTCQPLSLELRWTTEGLGLLLDKQKSTQLPWRKIPLPPRP